LQISFSPVANINDVARIAGVSPATVSRYLRGQRVRSGDAIRAAIKESDYWPTAAARSLRSGVHYAIAVVVPDITNPFFAALVKGIESVFQAGPYSVLLANTDESSELEDTLLADLVRRVDGVILAPATEQDETPLHVREAGLPVVFVDRELDGASFDSILVDNVDGGRQAARHLLDLGHRRIAMISGPLNTTPGRGRYEGFVAELAEHGVELDDDYCMPADFREKGGYDAMLHLLALNERPTAVFAANNVMTVGALRALHSMRVHVPGEMSIIGFDDLDLAAVLQPPLTVIDRPMVQQGVLAARLLLTRLIDHSTEESQRVVLSVRLVERGSTAPPRTNSWPDYARGEPKIILGSGPAQQPAAGPKRRPPRTAG
jgi:LacI family transcriptional regulator